MTLEHEAPALSDFELRYPFSPRSRKFFESIPIEESLTSKEVIKQAESRVLNSLGRSNYYPHLSELIEFTSFFVGALLASQDNYLVAKFARREGERSKTFFAKENPKEKARIITECYGLTITCEENGETKFMMRVEDYLKLVSRYQLTKIQRWRLARQALERGIVYLSSNQLNELFADCAEKVIAEGVRNLRRASFPKELEATKEELIRYIPTVKPKSGKAYSYIEELLKHPVSDGRHRLVWLVLAPYLVNVRKLDEDQAIEKIRAFVSVAGETRDLRRFVEYNVRRAKRNGLLPPTLSTLKTEHPDLFSLLPKEVLQTDTEATPKDFRS